jgi:UDP-4-keto-D-QuiNAc 4-reductase
MVARERSGSLAEKGGGAAILVTGAGGFIGRALVERLASRGTPVIAALRRRTALPRGVEPRLIGDLDARTDWPALLRGARAVVHLASRAHAPVAEARRSIEDEAAIAAALARAAVEAGVERVVLLSSVKVLGDATAERPFRADQPAAPQDAYGIAKSCIETAMGAAARDRLAIIRPPLVYGPGVKANFRAFIRLVDRGLPLPLAGIDNRRSLIFLENLIDLIETAIAHPAAAGGVFLLRDDEEVSTPELARRVARALGRPARLFAFPPALLRLAASLAGRGAAAERLLASLRVDDQTTRQRLQWRPRVALDDGIAATCRWWREERR